MQFLCLCICGGDSGYTVGCAGEFGFFPQDEGRGAKRGWVWQSVVLAAVLSSIFLKERLSFVGKIGCFMCLVGSVVIVINAPAQTSVNRIEDMQRFVISPGFLSYAGVVILGCAAIVVWVAPKWGNKSMMVYITVCSLIGGLR